MKSIARNLTVVIPVYNREVELKRCLDSIEAQSVLPSAIIVVDDGSTDRSVEVARAHSVGATVIPGPHLGSAAARNTGLEQVSTDWTMFFDSDDTMESDHIESAIRLVDNDVDVIGWDVRSVLNDGTAKILPFETIDMQWHNIMHATMATQRYMARTSIFREAGGWNSRLQIWNDIELGARILRLSPRIRKADGVRVNQYVGDKSMTGPSWDANTDKYPATFEALARTIGRDHPDWLDLKKAILAADIRRENSQSGLLLFKSITNKSFALRFAYYYRRLGGRGAARLLRRFMSK